MTFDISLRLCCAQLCWWQDVRWLGRAHHFARQMFSEEVQKQSRTPDNPFSLFDPWQINFLTSKAS
jgi:hypothetical protein